METVCSDSTATAARTAEPQSDAICGGAIVDGAQRDQCLNTWHWKQS